MELQLLHVQQGDKKQKFDTDTPAGRKQAGDMIKRLLRQGTAIFVERGDKLYRVKRYDEANDKLVVKATVKGKEKEVTTRGKKAKTVGVAPVAGGVEDQITEEDEEAALSRYLDEDTIPVTLTVDDLRRSGFNGTTQQAQDMIDEMALLTAVKQRVKELARRVRAGEAITSETFYRELNEVATASGCHHGIPLPEVNSATGDVGDHPLVLAHRVPMGITNMCQERPPRTEFEARMRLVRKRTRNSWTVLGDHTVCVVDTTEGPMYMRYWHAGTKLRKLISGVQVRMGSQLTAEAELKAVDALREKINKTQFCCYVLNDCFMEKSKRSGVHYIFRKGYPTLAVSARDDHGNPGPLRMLAALCLHPVGFYQDTHAGVMTPTDEVIAHLVMMRADEHCFWKKSGQWASWDTRSGL